MTLGGKVVVVTGAGGLLGSRYVSALASAGASVVAADLDEDSARRAVESIGGGTIGGESANGNHRAVGVDIADPASLGTLAEELLSTYGRVDGLVNNAAVNDAFERPELAGELTSFERYPLEQWKRSLEVNVTGTFLASQVIGSLMAEAGRGSIVNVASTYGMVGPDQSIYRHADGSQDYHKSPAYPTSKGAVIAFTRYLAAYWGHRGVRVNTLSPGGVANGQDDEFIRRYAERTPLGRMAGPDDYSGAVVFLCSDQSSYMTGANLVVDGGWTAW